MYEFWYDYLKPKYGENAKNFYMDTDSFLAHIKTNDIYEDIAKDVETRFDTSNFEIDRPLPKERKKKVIGLMKDELDPKAYSYLKDNNDEDKKVKGTKKCVIKRNLKLRDYKKMFKSISN